MWFRQAQPPRQAQPQREQMKCNLALATLLMKTKDFEIRVLGVFILPGLKHGTILNQSFTHFEPPFL